MLGSGHPLLGNFAMHGQHGKISQDLLLGSSKNRSTVSGPTLKTKYGVESTTRHKPCLLPCISHPHQGVLSSTFNG